MSFFMVFPYLFVRSYNLAHVEMTRKTVRTIFNRELNVNDEIKIVILIIPWNSVIRGNKSFLTHEARCDQKLQIPRPICPFRR